MVMLLAAVAAHWMLVRVSDTGLRFLLNYFYFIILCKVGYFRSLFDGSCAIDVVFFG